MCTNNITAQVISIQNKTEFINCTKYQNTSHTKSYYRVSPYSEFELPSCNPDRKKFNTYWAVLQDVCTNGTTSSFFATVEKNKTSKCSGISHLIVNGTACENDYIVTNDSLIIKNMSYLMEVDYICYCGANRLKANMTFAISYSIEILSK